MWRKKIVLILIAALSSMMLLAQEEAVSEAPQPLKPELLVIQLEKGWGYDILVNGRKYIHQTTIPSVPGVSAFGSERDAQKVGELVVDKIKRNIMPPSVTPEELQELGIITAYDQGR